jgi:hypothetical protein
MATVEECKCILQQEIALLERLAATQEVVRIAVVNRDWTDLERVIARLDEYGQEFKQIEEQRTALFSEITKESGYPQEEVGFYGVVIHLPLEQRKELTDLYRRLKLDTLRIRLANDSLNQYLSVAKGVVSDFLQAAFPDRKGKRYSRQGKEIHSEMRSIVLDRSF